MLNGCVWSATMFSLLKLWKVVYYNCLLELLKVEYWKYGKQYTRTMESSLLELWKAVYCKYGRQFTRTLESSLLELWEAVY